jgi:hypothetical protein
MYDKNACQEILIEQEKPFIHWHGENNEHRKEDREMCKARCQYIFKNFLYRPELIKIQ